MMKFLKFALFTLIILLAFSHLTFSTALINVPLDHWSYQFIERLQAEGILKDYLSNSKPYSRGEMAKVVLYIYQRIETGEVKLSKIETGLLEEMKREFAQELAELEKSEISGYKHLLDWTDGEMKLIAQISLIQGSIFNTEDKKYRGTLGFSFYGDFLRSLSFYNYSKASYEPDKKYPMSKQLQNDPRYRGDRIGWSDLSDAYFILGNSKVNLQAGKDAILWGPGYHGVIGLSGVEPTFDMVRFSARMWKMNFTSALGFLRDDLTKKYYSDVPRKYLAAHRFEILPYPGICIAWQEAYIYAEKLNFQLLNPIIPYQMTEDYLGDIGNNTMELDIEISLIPGVNIYSALFLDDFQPKTNPFKNPNFKTAILDGIRLVNPFGIDDTDIILEYARVDPWTYSHKGIYQDPPIPTTYTNFDEPLGHWIGPNADDLFTQVGWYISKNLYAKISYDRVRHGEIGGNMYEIPDYNNYVKNFLGGIVETTREFCVGIRYTTFGKFEIDTNYRYIKIENKQTEEAKLPKFDDRKQSWKADWNTTENEIEISVQFKY